MINKTFRLFISSTFSDFLTERAILNNQIFAAAEELCASRGYHFQLIDLRWGVNTESALNQQTISICLDEVRRCRTLSPRPNFLILSGERYGWIPLPPRMEQQRFETLLNAANDGEKALLCRWYEADQNALGGEWYLKSRRDEFVSEERWAEEEIALRRAMQDAGRRCGWSTEDLTALDTSATEQEILAGFLGDHDGSDNVIAVLRRGYPQKDADPTRALALQERIANAMESDGNHRCVLRLDWDETYEERFCRQVTDLLLANIEEEICHLEEDAQTRQDSYTVSAEEIFFGRSQELAQLEQYLCDKTDAPLFLWGDSGSGKTTLLRQFASGLGEDVFFASFGMDEHSYTLKGVLDRIQRWCEQICKTKLPSSDGPAEQMNRVVNALYGGKMDRLERWLENKCAETDPARQTDGADAPPRSPFGIRVIILDALDMYYDLDALRENFIPALLPDNVKIIFSAADQEKAAPFVPSRAIRLGITAFDARESMNLFDRLLTQQGRTVVPERQRTAVNAVFARSATPLQVKLTAETAAHWHSGDDVGTLPVSAEEIALHHMEDMFRVFGHERELTLYALALISVSPRGITEEELQTLLPRFPSLKAKLDAEDRYTDGLDKLPFVVWSRLFYDLGGCLSLEPMDGAIVVKFVHQVFVRAFASAHSDYCRQAEDALCAFYNAQPNYIREEMRLPNSRKMFSLLPLLERSGRRDQAVSLLCDVGFLDAYLHAVGLDETVQLLLRCRQWDCAHPHRELLSRLLRCLLDHRASLSCYPHTFLQRCREQGMWNDQTPYITEQDSAAACGESVFFPYSSDAKIYWQEETNRFAVYRNRYVYLCDGESGNELMRIFLPMEPGDEDVAHNFCWLGTDAVFCGFGKDHAEIYSIADGVPRRLHRLNWNEKSKTVAYSKAAKLLLLVADNCLYGVDPTCACCIWSYDIKQGKNFAFTLSADGKTVFFKNISRTIHILDAASGRVIRTVGHRFTHTGERRRAESNQHAVVYGRGGRWFIYDHDNSNLSNNFILLDDNTQKSSYLQPPMFPQIQEILPVDNAVVFRYRSGLLRMNLADLSLSFLAQEGICHISYSAGDHYLSILTNHGLYRAGRDHFTPMGINMLSVPDSSTVLLAETKTILHTLGHDFDIIGRLLQGISNAWSYPFLFSDSFDSDLDTEQLKRATLTAFAPDGKQAVAYERADALSVFDSTGNKLIHMDRLNLGIHDGILRMFFSCDSRYLLLWCNRRILVADTATGKLALKVDLSRAPALSAAFSGNAVELTLCDGSMETVPFQRKKVVIRRNISKKDTLYHGPYTAVKREEHTELLSYVDQEALSRYISCKKWLKSDRTYGELTFRDGMFALAGGTLDAPGMDFMAALELERRRDGGALHTYLREKNDLSYGVYPLGARYLLLVSPLLSSVLLIDKTQMQVVDAYRHHGPIIGHRMTDASHLELISPYGTSTTVLHIHT